MLDVLSLNKQNDKSMGYGKMCDFILYLNDMLSFVCCQVSKKKSNKNKQNQY